MSTNFPVSLENKSEEKDKENTIIDKISYHFISKIIKDENDNEMVIYHLYQTPELLEKLGYKKQLYKFMYENLDIDSFIKYAKYDETLD